jgi:hypothetical protein
MKLKNLLIIAVLVLSFTAANAQITYGVKAGLNIANQKLDASGMSVTPDARMSFHIGGFAEYELTDAISLQPALLISGKGCKASYGGDDYTTSLTYVEIPIQGIYKWDLSVLKIFVAAGPYFGVGVAGKAKAGSESETIKWGTADDSNFKRLDVGLAWGAGVELESGLIFSFNNDFGLSNIDAQGSSDYTVKNRVFMLTAGYRFGK